MAGEYHSLKKQHYLALIAYIGVRTPLARTFSPAFTR